MKNLKYIIAPAIAIAIFASCNTEVAAPSQADLDTQVEAKVKATTDQLKADCDARIMTAALLAKDSILVKMGTQKPAAPKVVSTPNTTKEQTPVKAPAPDPVVKEKSKGGLKGLSDQSKQEGDNSGKGLKGLSDQAKEKAKEEAPTKKGGLKGLSDQSK